MAGRDRLKQTGQKSTRAKTYLLRYITMPACSEPRIRVAKPRHICALIPIHLRWYLKISTPEATVKKRHTYVAIPSGIINLYSSTFASFADERFPRLKYIRRSPGRKAKACHNRRNRTDRKKKAPGCVYSTGLSALSLKYQDYYFFICFWTSARSLSGFTGFSITAFTGR